MGGGGGYWGWVGFEGGIGFDGGGGGCVGFDEGRGGWWGKESGQSASPAVWLVTSVAGTKCRNKNITS